MRLTRDRHRVEQRQSPGRRLAEENVQHAPEDAGGQDQQHAGDQERSCTAGFRRCRRARRRTAGSGRVLAASCSSGPFQLGVPRGDRECRVDGMVRAKAWAGHDSGHEGGRRFRVRPDAALLDRAGPSSTAGACRQSCRKDGRGVGLLGRVLADHAHRSRRRPRRWRRRRCPGRARPAWARREAADPGAGDGRRRRRSRPISASVPMPGRSRRTGAMMPSPSVMFWMMKPTTRKVPRATSPTLYAAPMASPSPRLCSPMPTAIM